MDFVNIIDRKSQNFYFSCRIVIVVNVNIVLLSVKWSVIS